MDRDIVKREKFSKIKKLRCFQRVHEMLSHGYPAPGVANFIREQGEYLHVKEQSLIEVLRKYRQEILPADVLVTRQPHVIIDARKQYTDKLEELRRMDDLYEALKYEFDVGHAQFRMHGFSDQEHRHTAKALMDLIYKMHMVKMDLGISGQRNLGTITVSPERLEEIRLKYGDKAAKAMSDPVSRARVIAYLKAAQDAAGLKAKEDAGEIIDVKVEK
jgi:hypothetical protein